MSKHLAQRARSGVMEGTVSSSAATCEGKDGDQKQLGKENAQRR